MVVRKLTRSNPLGLAPRLLLRLADGERVLELVFEVEESGRGSLDGGLEGRGFRTFQRDVVEKEIHVIIISSTQ